MCKFKQLFTFTLRMVVVSKLLDTSKLDFGNSRSNTRYTEIDKNIPGSWIITAAYHFSCPFPVLRFKKYSSSRCLTGSIAHNNNK